MPPEATGGDPAASTPWPAGAALLLLPPARTALLLLPPAVEIDRPLPLHPAPFARRQMIALSPVTEPVEQLPDGRKPARPARQLHEQLPRPGMHLSVPGEILAQMGRDDAEATVALQSLLRLGSDQLIECIHILGVGGREPPARQRTSRSGFIHFFFPPLSARCCTITTPV